MTEDTQKQNMPFGIWPSPISANMVGQGHRFSDVLWNTDGETLVWMTGKSNKGVLSACSGKEAARDLTVEENVRAWVGYGGGDFTTANGTVFFVEINGRLYRRGLGNELPVPITPAFGRTASPALSPDGKWLLFVYSDLKNDMLGMVDAYGKEWPVQISSGADFYMQPVWHPDGKRIAWVEWDHPNMPWDETRIMLGTLGGSPLRLMDKKVIVRLSDLPAKEPKFSPDGRWMSYIASNGEWEDLVLLDLENGKEKRFKGDGFDYSYNAWGQGMHAYGWTPDSKKLYTLHIFAGRTTVWLVDIESGISKQIDTGEYTNITQLSVSPVGDKFAFIGSAPHIPTRIVRWDGKLSTVAYSTVENLDRGLMPDQQLLTWKAPDGMTVFGHYYPPANPHFTGSGLPPAILHVHGGPTSGVAVSYNAMRNYFTSRGYAFLDVDYRGSSGYGLAYQRSMRQRWGEVDTEDMQGAVQALKEHKLADVNRLAIMGGSAGGYLVLNALIHYPGLFKAGIDLYGVSNLFNLAMDTHKFESRYLDSMVGPLPETAARYREFSPIFHADKIRDPLAIFQGAEDPVVPPDQSEDIVALLQRNGVPYIYIKYDGEGHGFRKAESNIDFLQKTERFLRQYVLFA